MESENSPAGGNEVSTSRRRNKSELERLSNQGERGESTDVPHKAAIGGEQQQQQQQEEQEEERGGGAAGTVCLLQSVSRLFIISIEIIF